MGGADGQWADAAPEYAFSGRCAKICLVCSVFQGIGTGRAGLQEREHQKKGFVPQHDLFFLVANIRCLPALSVPGSDNEETKDVRDLPCLAIRERTATAAPR